MARKILSAIIGLLLPLTASGASLPSLDHFAAKERQRIEGKTRTADLTMSPEFREALLSTLADTRTGCVIEKELRRLFREGKLRFAWQRNKGQGAIAEFHSSGQIVFDPDRLLGTQDAPPASTAVVASFLVHEATHAIVNDLAEKGRFRHHDGQCKMNEALAYAHQAQFARELRASGVIWDEKPGIAAWDRRVIAAVKDLKKLNITASTPETKARDILTDLQLDAETDAEVSQAIQLNRLYGFIRSSADREKLFSMTEENAPRTQPTRQILDLIDKDLAQGDAKFERTFGFMKNRIPLYSDYPDFPRDLKNGKPYLDAFEAGIDRAGCPGPQKPDVCPQCSEKADPSPKIKNPIEALERAL